MIFSRIGLIFLFLAIQVYVLAYAMMKLQSFIPHIAAARTVVVALVIIWLINSKIDSSAKATWLALFAFVPEFGAMFLIFLRLDIGHMNLKRQVADIISLSRRSISQDEEVFDCLREESPDAAALASYVARTGDFPVYRNTGAVYFPLGDFAFLQMMEELKKAEHFIFIEFFIIGEGTMWGNVLQILAQKAKEGVDVRVMYDATCDLSLLPPDYPDRVRSLGIKCCKFDPLTPFLSTKYNFRDHRKIMVIDGKTAFTGGINLADEYINLLDRFGKWKDTAVLIRGQAVTSFTLMFLQMWRLYEPDTDFKPYLAASEDAGSPQGQGYVMPFFDSPLDDHRVGERVLMDLLNRAKRYVYIMTPYLLLGDEIQGAVRFAAERGVDVRIIMPGIPDKKIVYDIGRTYFPHLIDAGVKMYLYDPGFMHAKVWLSDDTDAFVGTINMDYRSFNHHFECGVYMYRTECLKDILKDFQETMKECTLLTMESARKGNIIKKAVGAAGRMIAPLL